MISDAQLRSLLLDCLKLWEVEGRVSVDDTGLVLDTTLGVFSVDDTGLVLDTTLGVFSVSRAGHDLRPLRWFYQTPERAAAKRPPRAAPSVVALLSALRNAMAGSGGDRLRVGGG